ncbi:MAG TPA: hypothetical protein VK638_01285, partial [Edaphobacter sp.]|nr:hypothetical protein [Edaphobacter sp.]
RNEQGAWRSGNRFALPTSPHPRRRISELRDKRATLTPHWYKRSGKPYALASMHEGLSSAVAMLARVLLIEPPMEAWWA